MMKLMACYDHLMLEFKFKRTIIFDIYVIYMYKLFLFSVRASRGLIYSGLGHRIWAMIHTRD